MPEVDIEAFNKAQSAKWMHLPNAFTGDLADELCKREGVQSMMLKSGEHFTFYGPGKLIILKG